MLKKACLLPLFSDNIFVMKTKLILGLIVFSLTFHLSTAVTRFLIGNQPSVSFQRTKSPYANKITLFIERDIANGAQRSNELDVRDETEFRSISSYLSSYADATTGYVNASESMNDGCLPGDFQDAWRAHMRAWRERADYLESMKEQSPQDIDRDEIAAEYRRQTREINTTWFKVLRVGQKYGATIPADAY